MVVYEVKNNSNKSKFNVDVLKNGLALGYADEKIICGRLKIECIDAPNWEGRERACGFPIYIVTKGQDSYIEIIPQISETQTKPFYRDVKIMKQKGNAVVSTKTEFSDCTRLIVSEIPPHTTMRYYFLKK